MLAFLAESCARNDNCVSLCDPVLRGNWERAARLCNSQTMQAWCDIACETTMQLYVRIGLLPKSEKLVSGRERNGLHRVVANNLRS